MKINLSQNPTSWIILLRSKKLKALWFLPVTVNVSDLLHQCQLNSIRIRCQRQSECNRSTQCSWHLRQWVFGAFSTEHDLRYCCKEGCKWHNTQTVEPESVVFEFWSVSESLYCPHWEFEIRPFPNCFWWATIVWISLLYSDPERKNILLHVPSIIFNATQLLLTNYINIQQFYLPSSSFLLPTWHFLSTSEKKQQYFKF